MMLRLYKFECRPNYPVCQGTMVFAVRDYADAEEMLVIAKKLAKSLGFCYPNSDVTLDYLGTLMPAIEHPEIPYVIDYQTGEY